MYKLVFFLLLFCQLVQATIYVVSPLPLTTCRGGQSCSVQWLDDGVAPLLGEIGPCHVGLHNGNQILVQQIDPVNVAATLSLAFTPDPQAGPNSGRYYINFTSVNPVGNPPKTYSQFSTFFTLTDMSGSFDSPLPSATSSISVPSSLFSTTPVGALPTTTSATPSASGSSPPIPSNSLPLSFSSFSSHFSSSSDTAASSSASTLVSLTPTPSSSTTRTGVSSRTPGGTITVLPSSSLSRTTASSSSSATNPSAPDSAGFLDGEPSRRTLAIVLSFTAASLVGFSFF